MNYPAIFRTHSLRSLLIICVISCFNISMISPTTEDWKLAKEKNGVVVYTRKVDGWDMKEFKAHVKIKSSLSNVERVLRDDENRQKWMHNTVKTKDVKRISSNEIYSYSIIQTPWPVADRDNVTRMRYKYISSKKIQVDMEAAKDGIKSEVDGIVRIKKMKGKWIFEDVGNGYVKVTQQAVAESGGNIPAWLANSGVVDSPYNTLLNMKNYIEGGNIMIKN